MTSTRICEAVWTLREGPLETEEVVSELFVAIGRVRYIEPARYDLNRRDQWRDYDGRRLIVDALTQRTQLVTIAEDRPVDQGGTFVVVSTGKQGRPPRASARWQQQWPPDSGRLQQIEEAAQQAFADLPLASFVLRVGPDTDAEPAEGDVVIGASRRPDQCDEIRQVAGSKGRSIGGGPVEGRTFAPPNTDEAPEGWNRLWNRASLTCDDEDTDGTSQLG